MTQGAPSLRRRSAPVSTQLQRYFAAILGFAVAATWLEAGVLAALVCVVAAAASYSMVVFLQPTRASRRPPRPKREPVRPRPQPLLDPEVQDAPSEPSATGTYGW
jgi:hypothetical protein